MTTTTTKGRKAAATVPVACPACSHPRARKYGNHVTVYECAACGCVHGRCYLGESYGIVKPWFAKDPVPAGEARPYDLECLGSKGLERRHGWFDPATGLITQVG